MFHVGLRRGPPHRDVADGASRVDEGTVMSEVKTFAAPSPDAGVATATGRVRRGSERHKALFCHALLSTFDPYKPATIDWPTSTPEARERLVSLPIWDIAVQTECKAGLRVATYAERVSDPLLKRAIELTAFEERRHKHVLHDMAAAGNTQDNNFTVSGTKDLGVDISVAGLMDVCLAENDRRLSLYDRRLLRPRLVPRLVRLARRFMRAPKRISA